MAKSYKPLDETSSPNRICLRCFNCKTRVFKDLDELAKWCQQRELRLHLTWKKHLLKNRIVQIYWCTKSSTKPRLFRSSDIPFMVNCKQFDEGKINGIT